MSKKYKLQLLSVELEKPSMELIKKQRRLLRNEEGIWFPWKDRILSCLLSSEVGRIQSSCIVTRGMLRVGEYDKGQKPAPHQTRPYNSSSPSDRGLRFRIEAA